MNKSSKNKHKLDKKETVTTTIVENLVSLGKICGLCFLIVFFVYNYGIRPVQVSGSSMYPTLDDQKDSYMIANAFSAKFLQIERGDIVVAYEDTLHKNIIKRVIGLPGETIYAENEKIYINGEELSEPYLDNPFAHDVLSTNTIFTRDFGPITLGDDEYWLLGDNRWISKDSIDYGAVKKRHIKACGVIVLTPFSRMRFVK